MTRSRTLLVLGCLASLSSSIPIDNGVEGEPEIECGPTSVTVNFNVKNEFSGHVYVKGLYDDDRCRSDEQGRHVAGIELPFDTCSVARTRSLSPKGIYVSTTIVISFHPQFVTKVDRAYRIQCFYMEADKTVSADLSVSELTTLFQTQVVPMPICKYEILDGGPDGSPVQFARIGQMVYHKWSCDSETVDTFCAIVHSCTVDDGKGERIQIINDDGCAMDKFLIDNLEYPADMVAGQQACVYKYADRSQLFYQCQISIVVKNPNEECPRPDCPEPVGFGAREEPVKNSGEIVAAHRRVLRKRSANYSSFLSEHTMDVRYEMTALDVLIDEDEETLRPSTGDVGSLPLSLQDHHVCVSTPVASALAALSCLLFLVLGVSIVAGSRKSRVHVEKQCA